MLTNVNSQLGPSTQPGISSHWQLYPLQVNPQTEEPYLRLPSPHDKIIITPPRKSDEPLIVALLNDPGVYHWVSGPPHPYLPQHAESHQNRATEMAEGVFRELETGDRGETLKIVSGCPVRAIREILEDGSEVYLGDIYISRCLWAYISDEHERHRLKEENEGKEIGDPEIVWTFGDYLAPSHHGRGIMTAVIKTILREWAIPRMGVRKMEVSTMVGNVGSVKVFEKNGFVFRETLQDCMDTRGTKKSVHILEWRANAVGPEASS